ncbi:MAG: hypothetical protein ACLTTU_05145 [Bilophila wadsworthia]
MKASTASRWSAVRSATASRTARALSRSSALGVEVCAACHGLAIDKMTALYGKRDDCSTCHPYHARPMHGKVYENRQATTKTVLE